MVHFISPLEGIDKLIYQLQIELNEQLNHFWNMEPLEYQCYGRTYSIPEEGGYKPHVYAGNGEYKEVLLDDKYVATSFFAIGDEAREVGTQVIYDVIVYFFVHLGRARPNNPNRMDLGAREDAQRVLNQNIHGFTLTSIVTGRNVLKDYNIKGVGVKGGNKDFDMQPFHCFAIKGTLKDDKPTFN